VRKGFESLSQENFGEYNRRVKEDYYDLQILFKKQKEGTGHSKVTIFSF